MGAPMPGLWPCAIGPVGPSARSLRPTAGPAGHAAGPPIWPGGGRRSLAADRPRRAHRAAHRRTHRAAHRRRWAAGLAWGWAAHRAAHVARRAHRRPPSRRARRPSGVTAHRRPVPGANIVAWPSRRRFPIGGPPIGRIGPDPSAPIEPEAPGPIIGAAHARTAAAAAGPPIGGDAAPAPRRPSWQPRGGGRQGRHRRWPAGAGIVAIGFCAGGGAAGGGCMPGAGDLPLALHVLDRDRWPATPSPSSPAPRPAPVAAWRRRTRNGAPRPAGPSHSSCTSSLRSTSKTMWLCSSSFVLLASDDRDPVTAWPGDPSHRAAVSGSCCKPEGSALLAERLEHLNGRDYRGKRN